MAENDNLKKNELKEKVRCQDDVDDLKERYKDEIGSERLMSCIKSIDDFIDILDRRDIINEGNTPSEMISNQYATERQKEEFDEEQIRKAQTQNSTNNSDQIPNINRQIGSSTAKVSTFCNPVSANLYDAENKAAIQKLVATEIGRSWRDFGRGLGIREGELDELEILYHSDFKSRIYKMFEIFEEPNREDVRKHVIIICDALEKSRRKDLSKKIQEILTR